MRSSLSRKPKTHIKIWRTKLVLLIVIVIGVLVLGNYAIIQAVKSDYYKEWASEQHIVYKELTPKRGEIFLIEKNTDNRFYIAMNSSSFRLWIDPSRAQERKDDIVEALVVVVEADQEKLTKQIEKEEDYYEFVKKIEEGKHEDLVDALIEELEINWEEGFKKIDDEIDQSEFFSRELREYNYKVESLNQIGIYIEEELKRNYPEGQLASQIIGFLGYQNDERTGQYGIEQYYNQDLEGVSGKIIGESDNTRAFWIETGDREVKQPRDGDDIILSLDRTIQYAMEEKLKEKIEKYQCEKGSIIIMDPNNGEIIAMVNHPSFDPNKYGEVKDPKLFLNSTIHETYEPGSIFKPITLSAGIDSGSVDPTSTYYDKGCYQPTDYKDKSVCNVGKKGYGTQTMVQILEKSLNTGAIHVMQSTGKETFAKYVKNFGFGQGTGIDLVSERSGNISSLEKLSGDVNFATASFGQGITVTPMEMIAGMSVVANGGTLVRPHLRAMRVDSDGNEEPYVQDGEPERIISEDTSRKLRGMMKKVVDNSLGHVYMEGYHLAGKTGTAQIPEKGQKGYSDEVIHSFLGYFPAFQPQYIIMVKLDKPQGVRYSSQSAAYVFREIVEYLINYYDIQPYTEE